MFVTDANPGQDMSFLKVHSRHLIFKKYCSEHHMLCHKHFKQTSFINFEEKELHRHAIPDAECNAMVTASTQQIQLPSTSMDLPTPRPSSRVLLDVTNMELDVTRCSHDAPISLPSTSMDLPTPGPSSRVLLDVTNMQLDVTRCSHDAPISASEDIQMHVSIMDITTQCPAPKTVLDISNLESKENKSATENIQEKITKNDKKHYLKSRQLMKKLEGFQDHGHHGRTDQVAVKALVFMLTGLRKSVKQPLAYYLSGANITSDRLMVLLKETLRACLNASINIALVVCDMASTNRGALEKLGATEDNPVITIDGKQILSIFDAPHLLKCFRNMFLKYDIKCKTEIFSTGEGIAKWSDIRAFHSNNQPTQKHAPVLEKKSPNPKNEQSKTNEQQKRNFAFAPALKKEHLDPNTRQKMKVSLAAQVLSSSVAGGMLTQIERKLLPETARTTAEVVLKLDRLFDLCNSSSPDLHRGKPYSTNLSETSPHLQYFKEMKLFFKNITFLGCPRTPPSLQGWIWTMNGIEMLWHN